MITLAGYTVIEEIHKGERVATYRARRDRDQMLVVLKVPSAEYPTSQDIARLEREYEMSKALEVAGVIRPYALEPHSRGVVLVLEDIGGASLYDVLAGQAMEIADFLQVAVKLAEIMGQLYQHHILHRDIKPDNIIVNPETWQVKVTDFSIASRLSQERPASSPSSRLEGTLAYMSPEQTGRMNRVVDYRADFYSLGVTFYEMLTGQLPFPTMDPVELVHCHIARQPVPPHERDANVPRVVSEIVMKLMAKNAEDRYQSAYGLKSDLEECLRQWRATGRVGRFALGEHDVSDRLQMPQRLVGREGEVGVLLDALERVSQGDSEVVWILGRPGTGKTVLARELYEPVVRRGGYFIAGQFDPLQQDVPYQALIQAFRSLVQQILTESKERINVWREELLATLGSNGQVMIQVIPEVELIIGPQPDIPDLAPAESQTRFRLVFQKFVRVFTRPERPLVIFVDDMQWVDSASLDLFKLLITASDSYHLLFVGAYRDDEVGPDHLLATAMEEIQQEGGATRSITLSSLNPSGVHQFILDLVGGEAERVEPLAEVVWEKTRGNPFFMLEFVQSLYDKGVIHFDRGHMLWQWDLDEIRAQSITGNVAELMVTKIQRLDQQTQGMLKVAACLGNPFDLQILALAYGKTVAELGGMLQVAVGQGLVLPLGEAYKAIEGGGRGLGDGEPIEFHFAHNRIQQAVYTLIPPEQRKAVHLQIGQLLLDNTLPERREEKIFGIVNQLNQGREAITEQTQRDELAALNLMAARKAKASTAFESVLSYSLDGLSLVGEGGWQRAYDLCLALHVEAAEAAYLTGDLAQMERLVAVVVQHARTLLDKVKVYEIRIRSRMAQHKPREAVEVALPVLRLLGIRLPKNPNLLHVLLGLLRTQLALAGKDVEASIERSELTDSHKLATMRIMSSMAAAAYVSATELFALLTFEMVAVSARYGFSPLAAAAYAAYGVILCGVLGNVESGYRYGELALRLLERFEASEFKAATYYLVYVLIRHRKDHSREGVAPLQEAYQSALETGDVEFAASAGFEYPVQMYFIGEPLEKVDQAMAETHMVLYQLKQERMLGLQIMYWQVVQNLIGRSQDPCQLTGDVYDEAVMLPLHVEANDRNALCNFYLHKLCIGYLFHEYAQALENAERMAGYLDSAVGLLLTPLAYFYDSLIRLALYADAPRSEQRRMLKKVAANQRKLKKWAQHAPMNHQHKWQLVEAERARVQGRDGAAWELYDQAIKGAQENGYINEESLAHERAALFYLERSQNRLARHHLRDAHRTYSRWGARAKVKDLEMRYPEMLDQEGDQPSSMLVRSTTTTTTAGQKGAGALDLSSVMKAMQVISGEIVLDRLLERLMGVVIENAGAQRGVFVLEEEGRWVVTATGQVERGQVVPQALSAMVEGSPSLPASVVNYVARTRESVILNDATGEGLFTGDPYVLENQPRSVLCVPLVNQGQLVGMLYLENNLTRGAFTPDRIEVLQMLAAQAAISVENARLYARLEEYSWTLEEKVAQRTEALARAMQAAEAANEAKSAFLSMVSHELRTPLTSVLGFAKLIKKRLDEVLLPLVVSEDRKVERAVAQVSSNIDIIVSEGERLTALINNVLDLAKIEAGRVEWVMRPILMASVIEQSAAATKALFETRPLKLVVDVEAGLPEVMGDHDRLVQVVVNLISNAVKFTVEGEVRVVSARWRVAEVGDPLAERLDPGDYLTVSVQDTGIGVAPKDIGKVFEQFVQVGAVQSAKPAGTGLGLPICKEIVEHHGGKIWLESELGVGSTFIFALPLEKASSVMGESSLAKKKPLVLVVDDEENIRILLNQELVDAGCRVIEAADGAAALTRARQEKPDLVILDVMMPPGISGFDVTAALKDDPATKDIPILILSVLENEGKGLRLGADGYLTKPLDLEKLQQVVAQFLDL